MKRSGLLHFTTLAVWLCGGAALAAGSPGPVPGPAAPAIPAPQDRPYPGVIHLSVDASDTERRIVRVHESIPLAGGGELTLLYPEWVPGGHAPEGPISRVAGLSIH